MPGDRGAEGDLGRLEVPDLSDHHDVRILPEHCAKDRGEGLLALLVHLDLVHAGDLVFDRVLDGHDVHAARFQPAEGRIQRGRLARSGGTGDEDQTLTVGAPGVLANPDDPSTRLTRR